MKKSKEKDRPNICIITSPRPMAGVTPLSNLVNILSTLSNELYVITGNEGDIVCKNHKKVYSYSIVYNPKTQIIARILNYIYLQLTISYRLMKLARTVDIWFFFMGEGLLLPILTLKLSRKPVILSLAASAPKIIEAKKNISLLDKTMELLEIINYTLSNRIFICSQNLIEEWSLEKYKNKISIAHEHFIDFNKFKIKYEIHERDCLIGYIGRLSEEKGVLNYIKAIPEIKKGKLKFLIGGDGELRCEIEEYLYENNFNNRIILVGWIPHDEIPDRLNELKLLVIPSYTESGPLIALEAMSCGTPILATPVGHIPDIVKDGETGFIMENNTPACIAENVLRALEHPDLERIVKNARVLVEREFTYEAAVERYGKILGSI